MAKNKNIRDEKDEKRKIIGEEKKKERNEMNKTLISLKGKEVSKLKQSELLDLILIMGMRLNIVTDKGVIK